MGPSKALETFTARRGHEGAIDMVWSPDPRRAARARDLQREMGRPAPRDRHEALGLDDAAGGVRAELIVDTDVQAGAQSAIIELHDNRELTLD